MASKKLAKLWVFAGPVLASILTFVITNWIQDRSPQILVRQFYNSVDSRKLVPTQVGGLLIDYQPESLQPHSEYVVQVMNEGRGPEEDVRLNIRFPSDIGMNRYDESALKIYQPDELSFNQGNFFVNLKQFPQNALAPVTFEVNGTADRLCKVKIQVAGRQKEGRVDALKGIKCAGL